MTTERTAFLWKCVCGETETPEPVPIFLHIARCESCTPGLRNFAREVIWENLPMPTEKADRFRLLLFELGICRVQFGDGCWWCDNGQAPLRHQSDLPYLLVAAVLVRLRVMPARIVQAQAVMSMMPASNVVEKPEVSEAGK